MQNQKDNLIAQKYAEALAEVREGETVIEDLILIKDSFEKCKELTEFLNSPKYSYPEKAKVINQVFKDKIQKEVLNTLLVLLAKRRINLAPLLLENYKEIYYQKTNTDLAKISSAKVLNPTELTEIKTKLEECFNKTIEINNEVDESLIAGIKIQVANKVIDASLKAKLKQLKSLLLK